MNEKLKNRIIDMASLLLSDKLYVMFKAWIRSGRLPRLNAPETVEDKVRWLMLHYRHPFQTVAVDKVAVRDYVAEKVGEKHLKKLIGIYDRAEEIDFDQLPNRFVLKTNHGSGWNIICEDKEQLDIAQTVEKLNGWINQNYYHRTKEWAYKRVVPKILCEEYYADEMGRPLDEYNIFCCFGEPVRITVVNRLAGYTKNCLVDPAWQLIDTGLKKSHKSFMARKPDNLDELLDMARKLSSDLPYCRIDLFQYGPTVIFGEITLYPGGGQSCLMSIPVSKKYGAMLDLDRVRMEYM